MPYATRQDLEQLYGAGEVSQRASALPAGAVDTALGNADALIDGYLAGRYTLPLSQIPPNLPQVACALVRYALLGDAATERARNDQKDALAWLRDVQSGRVLLQAAAPTPGSEPGALVMMSSSEAVFKRSGRP
jgi:phage gp36-like protein